MKIIIGGDYVPKNQIAEMMERDDFSYLDAVKQINKDADYSIINLEVPIIKGDYKAIEKCGPNLKTTPKVVNSLRYAGVDMVTLANNHIMDYGEEGLQDTLSELDKSGVSYVGAGRNLSEASEIKYIEIDNKRLAIINCCEHEFSIASENQYGANPLNPIHQYYAINEARNNADYVLVIVHGGHEHWQLPSRRMIDTYRYFIDLGVDVVVNHHQHCYSGYELYKGKPIFYGLGNLCFQYPERKNSIWNQGYMVKISFEDSISFEIIPYVQGNENPEVKLLPKNAFDTEINRINDIIKNPEELQKQTKRYYNSTAEFINAAFEPYRGRILYKLYSWGLIPSFIRGRKRQLIKNLIICESHRDKLTQIL